jgi:hypothetical protein
MEMVIVGAISVVLIGSRLPSVASAMRESKHGLRCRQRGWMSIHPKYCQHCGGIKHPEV